MHLVPRPNWDSVSISRNDIKKQRQFSRKALDGQESVLGHSHTETILSMFWLGRSLLQQGKYQESETMFRRALQG